MARKPKVFDPPYRPAADRYERMEYRRCGRSGLKLPAISLGLWHNFGDDTPHQTKRDICRAAFDHGITHFDLANNYGPPPGSAEIAFGRLMAEDFAPFRDELIISSKAGYDMWAGPYGEWGSRKYLIASCDASLKRTGLDYFDIFYSHRFDPETPLEETMGALDQIVRSGKALYAGISSYNAQRTREAAAILRDLATPCLIHQPSYNMLNRWVERDGLLDALEDEGIGSIAFTPLAQGLLTKKYLGGIPEGSRATQGKSLDPDMITKDTIAALRGLNEMAESRGQTLAQMAIAWVLRGGRVTSALIGASRPEQVVDCAGAARNLDFTDEELARIDELSGDKGLNLWAASSEGV
ncbi:L-glyceraldehyde 3-phosphate reductase [Jannaschia formosa]|uniref:L-glyceraldehyde 3-phosphate reductase n=1 Tax=Jannaschia formosa TaxID=2259592 RepID=UPI000E1BA67D|nr:L-glyceraldehyde 3-phosphate reductase [Jannaschia formosa]TFL17026.1 L-glyceraldehyde 3-phosphate reductase [Jannaschia formosa]